MGRASLRSLPRAHPWVRRADQLRRDVRPSGALRRSTERRGSTRPSISARPMRLRSPSCPACSTRSGSRGDHEVVVVVASSTGWYTALAASGALEFDDAFRLVQTMALLAEEPIAKRRPRWPAHLCVDRRGMAARSGPHVRARGRAGPPDRWRAPLARARRVQHPERHRGRDRRGRGGSAGGRDRFAALPVPRRHAGGVAHPAPCRGCGPRRASAWRTSPGRRRT